MQELTTLQLIDTFKTFITACQLSMEIPDLFMKKWQVFSHFLNIYPLHSYKLVEYSNKCTDSELEKKFMEDNLMNFSKKMVSPRERMVSRDFINEISYVRSVNNASLGQSFKTQSSYGSDQKRVKSIKVSGDIISMINVKQEKTKKMQSIRQNVLNLVRDSVKQMNINSSIFRDKISVQPNQNKLNESGLSEIVNEEIKKMDIDQLRQKIIIIKATDKLSQEQKLLIVNKRPSNQFMPYSFIKAPTLKIKY